MRIRRAYCRAADCEKFPAEVFGASSTGNYVQRGVSTNFNVMFYVSVLNTCLLHSIGHRVKLYNGYFVSVFALQLCSLYVLNPSGGMSRMCILKLEAEIDSRINTQGECS